MPFNLGDLIHIGMQVGLEALNDPKKRAIAIAIASLIQKIITDPNAAADALSDALGGRPADRVFAAQMKELSSTIRTLNGLFEHVAEGLQTFDRENIWGDHGVYVEFAPRWQSIVQVSVFAFFYLHRSLTSSKRFNINLSQSRAASGRMQGRCESAYFFFHNVRDWNGTNVITGFWKEILPMLKMKTSDISDQEKYDRLGLFLGVRHQLRAFLSKTLIPPFLSSIPSVLFAFRTIKISVTHDHMWEEALLQDQIASSNISQEFTNIQIAISGFRAEFQAYSRKAAENLNEQVRSLTRQMEKLQQSLVGLQISVRCFFEREFPPKYRWGHRKRKRRLSRILDLPSLVSGPS